MRSQSTLRRWVRDLRTFIDDSSRDSEASRVAYAVETALRVALSKPGDHVGYNPVRDAQANAALLPKARP